MNTRTRISTILLAGALALTSAASTGAQRTNTIEVTPTPTERPVRHERDSSRSSKRLAGAGQWEWTTGTHHLAAVRMDMDGGDADLAVYMMSEPDLIEDRLDMDYEASLSLPRTLRDCEGVEMSEGRLTVYLVFCPDGDYVNMSMGTDEDDVIDVAEQMQDGKIPVAPRGYREGRS